MRFLAIGSLLVLLSEVAAAQAPIFRTASRYTLPGASPGFFLNTVAVADVGALAGAPDGIPDLITANQNYVAPVLFGNGDGSFSEGPSTVLMNIPTALAAADFTNDGLVDLVVADVSGKLTVFQNPSDGMGPPFQQLGSPITVGSSSAAIVVVDYQGHPLDFDGDHKRDLVIVNGDCNTATGDVTILFGNNDGTFRVGTTIPAGEGSCSAVLGDFSGDNHLDIAVSNVGSNDVSILQGDGTGVFFPVQTVPAGDGPLAVLAADLHKSGRLDLIVADRNADQIGVLDAQADHSFAAARFFPSGSRGSAPNGLALADLDTDGNVDAIVCNKLSGDVGVLLGDGHGSFGRARAFVTDQEPDAIAVQDFDGDPNHIPDIVTVNEGSHVPSVAVLIGMGGGSFTGIENVITQPSPTTVTAGDVDNDGVPDLMVAHNTGDLLIYRAEPPNGFAAPLIKQSAGDAIALGNGDLNGDGRLDMVAVNKSTMNVTVFLGRADGNFADPQNSSTGPNAVALAVGDWNRDGRDDLAVARVVPSAQPGGPSTGAIDILLANTDGTLTLSATPSALPQGPTAIDSGDVNNDHKIDLVVASSASVFVLLGNSDGTFQSPTSLPFGGATRTLVLADFDRDTSLDIALGLSADPVLIGQASIIVLYGDGQGGFAEPNRHERLSGTPSSLAARDVTGDLIPDLLVTDQVENGVEVFVGNGTRALQRCIPPLSFGSPCFTVSRSPVAIVSADFDADGRYDAATANASSAGSTSVLTNIAATPAVLRGDGNGDGRVTAADLVAVVRQVNSGDTNRIEDVHTAGVFAGVDANGDGLVTRQDALAVAHRLFPRI